jgi:hypothetical protein
MRPLGSIDNSFGMRSMARKRSAARPLLRAVAVLWALVAFAAPARAQLAAAGSSLTVTTGNVVATFAGPDLIGLVNRVTGETYLNRPTSGELGSVNAINSGGPLTWAGWSLGTDPTTGQPAATLVGQRAGSSMTLVVRIDGASQEMVVRLSASVSAAGLRDASWSLAGLDLTSGRLIVPGHSGMVFDHTHAGVGTFLQYPNTWQAQMLAYEATAGSFVVYSTDSSYAFKQLRISTRGNASIDVAVVTEAGAPFPSASAVPTVEWRLKAFAGDWRVAAGAYRTWLQANRPPLPDDAPWVADIRAVVGIRVMDANLLAPLAARVAPQRTLLYVHDWRRDNYDVNYPDYTPRANAAAFMTQARALGFKVMLHVDLIGVSPPNADYASVQHVQTRTPESLERMGWKWDLSVPYRFAFISPAASAFRSLFIERVRVAVNTLAPDALHLDISAPMYNDGNGLIEGLTYPQGSVRLHEDLRAAFPGMVLGGEGENDILYRYHAFAQAWYFEPGAVGHPITTFLFSPKVQYYGHLGQPEATDPSFREDLLRLQRRGVLPQLPVNAPGDLDPANADMTRLVGLITAWQTHGFKPAWAANWSGALVRYEGGGQTAAFADAGGLASLVAAGRTLFTIAHDADRLTTSSFVPAWPAFDATTMFGLDRTKKYYLDALPRPPTTHVTALPADVRLGAGTLVGSGFASIEVSPQIATAFDFSQLLDSRLGVRYQGTETPLGNGAVVYMSQISAGGVMRTGLFTHPPYQAQVGGETFVEYRVAIPVRGSLQFSVGVDDNASCTDGVTFRVVVNGAELWQRHVQRTGWTDAVLDLSAYGGLNVPVRLLTHPGPAGNPSCDWAMWSGVAVTPEPSTPRIDVPVSLAAGATVAGFDGDGSVSGASPAITVASVPVPGVFVLFTQPGTPVFSGTNLLLGTPFHQVWRAAHGELSVPGSTFGSGEIRSASSGGVMKSPAVFAHPPGGRTTLSWLLRLPANEGLRLGWSAGLADGSASDDGVDFVVRINGVSYWQGSRSMLGWLPGSLELSRWRGQTVLLELITDARASFGFDWAYWADLVLTSSTTSCSYAASLTPTVSPSGGSFSATVSAPGTCPWKAVSDAPWLTVTGSGSGPGSFNFAVAPNGGGTRTALVTVGSQPFTITQVSASLFTDDPLASGSTAIRAVHIIELRTRIDALRTRYGLGPFPWRDHPLVARSTPIRAIHIVDLRTALLQVYAARGIAPPGFAESGPVSGMVMRASHIAELRAAVRAVE